MPVHKTTITFVTKKRSKACLAFLVVSRIVQLQLNRLTITKPMFLFLILCASLRFLSTSKFQQLNAVIIYF